MTTYTSILTLAFVAHHSRESGPTPEEAIPALLRRVAEVLADRDEAQAALCEDTVDTEIEDAPPTWRLEDGVVSVTVMKPPVQCFSQHAALGKDYTR